MAWATALWVKLDKRRRPPVGRKRETFEKLLVRFHGVIARWQGLIEPRKDKRPFEGHRHRGCTYRHRAPLDLVAPVLGNLVFLHDAFVAIQVRFDPVLVVPAFRRKRVYDLELPMRGHAVLWQIVSNAI